jgi:hypothetical protein
MFQKRYTPGRYQDCSWCRGRGCAACDGEAKKDYQKAFPNGPEPIASFQTDTPDGIAEAKKFLADLVGDQASQEVLALCHKVNAEHVTQ